MNVRLITTPLLVAVVTFASLASCGASDDDSRAASVDSDVADVLESAQEAMAALDRGEMVLELRATAGQEEQTAPVGFRVEGPFSYAEGTTLPVLDLTSTNLLGDQEIVTAIVSTGEALFLVADGEVTEVPSDQTAALRLGSGDSVVGDLGVAGWVREGQVTEGDDGDRTVTGEADAADLLGDLARLGAQVGGGTEPAALDDEAGEQLNRLVRSSDIVLELGPDDLPRSLVATIDFGTDVPADLEELLGPYASTRLVLTLEMQAIDQPLDVAAPS